MSYLGWTLKFFEMGTKGGGFSNENTVYISTQDVAFNAHDSKKHYTEDMALPNYFRGISSLIIII